VRYVLSSANGAIAFDRESDPERGGGDDIVPDTLGGELLFIASYGGDPPTRTSRCRREAIRHKADLHLIHRKC
jgi:hypothetical protein